jgi:hypothetical protein
MPELPMTAPHALQRPAVVGEELQRIADLRHDAMLVKSN